MRRPGLSLFLCVAAAVLWRPSAGQDPAQDDGGYYRREHSLVQPYEGAGLDIPYWEFRGSTVITSNYVRLTPDRQSMTGTLWNAVPINMHNWEVLLHFHVHGSGQHLFGDGFALWYTKEKGEMGPVFGNRDYFTGLGVFFDTYSNYAGEHLHDHPYVSATINNGSVHYDHDRDGTHSQVAGCTAKFRNSDDDTFAALSYIDRRLTLVTNLYGRPDWDSCFVVEDIDLPTGYFFGVTAVTGDLADNHDIVSFKMYEVDTPTEIVDAGKMPETLDWSTIMPHAKYQEAAREHVDQALPWFGPHTYKAISIGLLILLVLVILAVIGGAAFLSKQKSRKHFF